MENKKISNYTELKLTIELLNSEKRNKEETIKRNFKQVKESLTPINILKNYLRRITRDNELYTNSLSAIVSQGAKFLVRRMAGNNNTKRRNFIFNILESAVSGSGKS